MSDENVSTTDTTTPATEAASSTEAVVVSGEQQQPAAEPAQGTLLSSDPVEKPVAAPADWPKDWHSKLAGEDAKELARLQRFGSPADVWKAYRALEAKVSSGQLKAGLKPDASPEEVAAWRREQGLPETPDGYKPELPNGMVLGEAEKPILDGFRQTAHELNMTPEQFNKTLGWYFSQVDQQNAAQAEADQAFRAKAEDDLRAEWGANYRAEVRGIMNFLQAEAPPGMADRLFAGRTEDGKVIGNDPEVLRFMASLVRRINPMSTLVPAGTADAMKAGEARIAEIESVLKTDPRRYWGDESLQTEYRNLLDARERSRSSQAA